jgi:hypothetical protein
MPDIVCECGSRIGVALIEAGRLKKCPSCDRSVRVPSLLALKKLQGDDHPLLNAWEKLKRAIQCNEAPFDGVCQRCSQAPEEVRTEVELSVLLERALSPDQGVLPGPGVVVITADQGESVWNTVHVPVLL